MVPVSLGTIRVITTASKFLIPFSYAKVTDNGEYLLITEHPDFQSNSVLIASLSDFNTHGVSHLPTNFTQIFDVESYRSLFTVSCKTRFLFDVNSTQSFFIF